MKRKTIKAVLNKKFEDFTSSIEDKYIVDLIKNNTVITGGCITSMLLNEKINDFDLYFRTKDSAKAVSNYFISKAKRKWGEKFDIELQDNENRLYIKVSSVGIADSVDIKHIDDILSDDSNYERMDDAIFDKKDDNNKKKYDVAHISSNAITLTDGIQIIARFHGDPEEIHKFFDFVHCQAYWTSWNNELTLPPRTLEAILNRELVYNGSLYPICSVIRTRKFIKRGWSINAGQYLKMCFQIGELDLYDVNVLEDQLVGVDALYFMEIIDQIKERKEKDPHFQINSGYLATIIDRIF